jgi:hypothetical protein
VAIFSRRTAFLLAASAALGFAAPLAAEPVSPFANLDLTHLVVTTPGVTRDGALTTGSKIYVNVADMKYGGFVRVDRATSGQTIDGDWLLAVPLDTERNGRIYTALVYRSTGGAPEYVGAVDSKAGTLEVSVHDGHLFVTAPLYAKKDLPCCPSYKVVERILYSTATGGLIQVTRQTIDLGQTLATPSPSPR